MLRFRFRVPVAELVPVRVVPPVLVVLVVEVQVPVPELVLVLLLSVQVPVAELVPVRVVPPVLVVLVVEVVPVVQRFLRFVPIYFVIRYLQQMVEVGYLRLYLLYLPFEVPQVPVAELVPVRGFRLRSWFRFV